MAFACFGGWGGRCQGHACECRRFLHLFKCRKRPNYNGRKLGSPPWERFSTLGARRACEIVFTLKKTPLSNGILLSGKVRLQEFCSVTDLNIVSFSQLKMSHGLRLLTAHQHKVKMCFAVGLKTVSQLFPVYFAAVQLIGQETSVWHLYIRSGPNQTGGRGPLWKG